HLGEHVGRILGAAVNLGLALLATKTLDLRDGHARHADGPEGFAHLVELEWFDDGDDEFHHRPPVTAGRSPAGVIFAIGVPIAGIAASSSACPASAPPPARRRARILSKLPIYWAARAWRGPVGGRRRPPPARCGARRLRSRSTRASGRCGRA